MNESRDAPCLIRGLFLCIFSPRHSMWCYDECSAAGSTTLWGYDCSALSCCTKLWCYICKLWGIAPQFFHIAPIYGARGDLRAVVAPNRWGTRIAETQHSPNFFKSWGTSNAEPNNPPFFQAVGQRASQRPPAGIDGVSLPALLSGAAGRNQSCVRCPGRSVRTIKTIGNP